MKLQLNSDYAKRHLFVTVLMLAMCGWFGYDGFIRYPSMPAAALYAEIEKSEPPKSMSDEKLNAFKRQKIQTQYGFSLVTLLIAAVVGLRLLKASRFSFDFDDNGFSCLGRRYPYSAVKSVDRSRWEKKSILVISLEDGNAVTLDGWHHRGVKDFAAKLPVDGSAK